MLVHMAQATHSQLSTAETTDNHGAPRAEAPNGDLGLAYRGLQLPQLVGALCKHQDPAIFFPEAQGGGSAARYRPAKAACCPCPIRRECLQWALFRPERHGVWGGTTPDERKAMLKAGLRSVDVA